MRHPKTVDVSRLRYSKNVDLSVLKHSKNVNFFQIEELQKRQCFQIRAECFIEHYLSDNGPEQYHLVQLGLAIHPKLFYVWIQRSVLWKTMAFLQCLNLETLTFFG